MSKPATKKVLVFACISKVFNPIKKTYEISSIHVSYFHHMNQVSRYVRESGRIIKD